MQQALRRREEAEQEVGVGLAALIAALIPLVRSYGLPHGWKPDLGTAFILAAVFGTVSTSTPPPT